MAQVPQDVGCDNQECIAKDECKRNEIYKNKTARIVKTFNGLPTKKCGKFLQK